MKFSVAIVGALVLTSFTRAAPFESQQHETTLQRLQRRAAGKGGFGSSLPRPASGSTTIVHSKISPVQINDSENNNSTASNGTSSNGAAVTTSDTQYFSNWAGALWVHDGITEVEGKSNVPTASVPPGHDSSETYGGAVWVGIDGDTCGSAILQTGVSWTVENGQASYSAWYEWYPAPLTSFDNFEVKPGDTVTMKVVATSKTSGTATVTNDSTGKSVTKTFANQPSLCQQNAEWIVEDFATGGDLIPFAAFTPVHITDAKWQANGNTYGLDGATLINIKQDDKVLTDCHIAGSTEVDCSYTQSK